MFPRAPNEADRSGNVRAGTIIDRDIASPHFSDFVSDLSTSGQRQLGELFWQYLMSHSGLLGTSKPTHYTVLLNESKMSVDQIQKITFDLAHVYARSTRAVSIAAPVYYSHLGKLLPS